MEPLIGATCRDDASVTFDWEVPAVEKFFATFMLCLKNDFSHFFKKSQFYNAQDPCVYSVMITETSPLCKKEKKITQGA